MYLGYVHNIQPSTLSNEKAYPYTSLILLMLVFTTMRKKGELFHIITIYYGVKLYPLFSNLIYKDN